MLMIGNLACFHILTTMNNATINIVLQVSFWDPYFIFQINDDFICIFWGTTLLNFIMVTPISIPINSLTFFSFLHILTKTSDFYFWLITTVTSIERYHCGFDLNFSNKLWCWIFLIHLLVISMSSRNASSIPLPI